MARKLIVEIVGDTSNLEKSFRQTSHGAKTFEKDLSKTTRGVIAGSGAFQGLGRSVAFASSYFVGAVGITALLTKSVEAATESASAQRQLAAQFKASGQNIGDYRSRIEEATLAVSRLSGFNETELTQSFTAAFRQSQKVGVSLQIQATAADVARGRHIELSAATLALSKAYSGQATALKRLGIIVPAHLKGMAALEFVQQRFAGQAQAGTTAQERFSAALHNTEVSIGTALLPILNKYLNKATDWLDQTENQRKIQNKFKTTVDDTAKALSLLGDAYTVAAAGAHGLKVAQDQLQKHPKNEPGGVTALKQLLLGAGTTLVEGPLPLLAKLIRSQRGGGGGSGAVGGSADRQLGRSPGGAGSFQPIESAVAQSAVRAAGLHAQFVKSQLALAIAQVTATNADDRRILAQQAKIIRSAISQTSNLKKRKALYEQLGSVENQIRSIDAQAASAKADRQQKELDARKRQREHELALYQKTKAQADKILADAKARVKAQNEALKNAADVVRSTLGGLFAGPVFNAPAGVLGVSNARAVGGTVGAGGFVSNVRQQTAQLVAFNNDLARLARRGAPGGLISQLRQGGLEQGPLIHQLATAGRPTLRSLFRAFAQQEKVVQQIAHADVQAKTVTIVAGNLTSRATTPSSQRRGRQAGVPSSIGSFINP